MYKNIFVCKCGDCGNDIHVYDCTKFVPRGEYWNCLYSDSADIYVYECWKCKNIVIHEVEEKNK